jgi:hypothetical protein
MQDRPSVVALRDALLSVSASNPTRTDAALQLKLRSLVYTVVDDMKAEGWPPERAILGVRLIATDAGLHPSRGVLSTDAKLSEVDAVLFKLFGWCLERYFDDALSR